jgi:hypothetical protein
MSEEDEENRSDAQDLQPWRDPATGRFRATAITEGDPRWAGRPRGSANRTTVVMRSAISAVFEDLQALGSGPGEYPHFLAWAQENPTEFYRIAARQLPLQVEATGRAIGVVVYKGLND